MSESTVSNIIKNGLQKTFPLDIRGQKYELSVLSFVANDNLYFYSIFKPTEYDHIIYSSEATPSWNIAKINTEVIFDDVCKKYDINREDYSDIVSFIS